MCTLANIRVGFENRSAPSRYPPKLRVCFVTIPVACKTTLAGEADNFQRWTEEHQDQSNRLLKELDVIQVRPQAHLPGKETPDPIYIVPLFCILLLRLPRRFI